MKYFLPFLSGFLFAYLGFGLDSLVFWIQITLVSMLVTLLP